VELDLAHFDNHYKAARLLFELVLSKKFNKKIKLIFDEDIARGYPGHPLSKLKCAIDSFKKNKRYAKLLGDLEMVTVPSSDLVQTIEQASGNKDEEIFVFSLREKRSRILGFEKRKNVYASYIQENRFPEWAYYPLVEMLIVSLARSINPDIAMAKDLINIESVDNDGKTLIFTLLPDAVAYDKAELLHRYSILSRFLTAA